MVKFLTNIVDVIDAAYLRVTRREILPPFSLRGYVGPRDEFERIPAEYIAYLKLLCGLKMDDAVLDIGCGVGRIALQLSQAPHFFRGRYCGFDVDERSIDWAIGHISSIHPNFEFSRIDIGNTHYNPKGAQSADAIEFPYRQDTFDVALAISIFTHLLPLATVNYLRQTKRVLKRGGRALFTFILLQDCAETLTALAESRRPRSGPSRWHHFDGYAILDPEAPESVTAYQETWLRETVEREGLRIDKLLPGSWNHRDGTLAFQDVAVLVKP